MATTWSVTIKLKGRLETYWAGTKEEALALAHAAQKKAILWSGDDAEIA